MTNFCTLFNSTYLTRGLAMYQSLEKVSDDFHLYIIAFDSDCCNTLTNLRLRHATVISLEEFENPELLRVKPTRTATEYCWTCTPMSVNYCLDRFKLDMCTYIDADLLFFSDPAVLIEEMGDASVLITEHRYSRQYDQTAISGKYCVQFVAFRNDPQGREVLTWWMNACLEWCYNRIEDNKFGDQKYLDDWCERFDGVHELQHPGGGVAPWNMQQFHFDMVNGQLIATETATGNIFPVVFFHFHGFRYHRTRVFSPAGSYDLNANVLAVIYVNYIRCLNDASVILCAVTGRQQKNFHESLPLKKVFRSPLRIYKLYVRGHFKNYYRQSCFKKLSCDQTYGAVHKIEPGLSNQAVKAISDFH